MSIKISGNCFVEKISVTDNIYKNKVDDNDQNAQQTKEEILNVTPNTNTDDENKKEIRVITYEYNNQ